MKITDNEVTKMVQEIRRGNYFPFYPVTICSLAAVGFAIYHYAFYTIGFAFSAVVYLPTAIRQYHQSRQICEKTFKNYLQWLDEQQE